MMKMTKKNALLGFGICAGLSIVIPILIIDVPAINNHLFCAFHPSSLESIWDLNISKFQDQLPRAFPEKRFKSMFDDDSLPPTSSLSSAIVSLKLLSTIGIAFRMAYNSVGCHRSSSFKFKALLMSTSAAKRLPRTE